jgi:cytochrome oxidase Cu insertion factor (SCO1/SenC/PrrC family)
MLRRVATFAILLISAAVPGFSQQSPLAPPKMPAAPASSTKLKLGDKAPDFALPNGDGKLVTLSEYTSKSPVVIVFYRGFW